MAGETAKVCIGTCKWTYRSKGGAFYPDHIPPNQRLRFYAQHFSAVEISSTIHHPAAENVTRRWLEMTPPGFQFCLRLPREISHRRRLRQSEGLLAEFLAGLRPLGKKLGCVLVELPGSFTLQNDERALRAFVRRLPRTLPWAVEFPLADWRLPRIVHLLEEHGVAWAWTDRSTLESQAEAAFEFLPRTSDFVYLRLLGKRSGDPPNSSGSHFQEGSNRLRDEGLENWALRIRQLIPLVASVFVFASDQFEGFAPRTAYRFQQVLGGDARMVSPGFSGPETESSAEQLELL